MSYWRSLKLPLFCLALLTSSVLGQDFDCIELNDSNTNVFVYPDACLETPESLTWCTCAKSAFTDPTRGAHSGFNQALIWVIGEPGIGNHRTAVAAGTLDLSGLTPGDVIGVGIGEELVPTSFPFVGGELFRIDVEFIVTAVIGDTAEFVVNVTAASNAVQVALSYDPTDANHANGHMYDGYVRALGPGKGFVMEYRYAKEEVRDDLGQFPAIQPDEVGSPTFTIPFLIQLFSTSSKSFQLPVGPDIAEVEVRTTLRRFTDGALDEIMDLGANDLCKILNDPSPCKTISELLPLRSPGDANNPPVAEILAFDPFTLVNHGNSVRLDTFCGRAQVLLRGSNSRDGDGGYQPLLYAWRVESPEGLVGGAEIPELTRDFKDTHVFFTRPGDFTVIFEVDDQSGMNSTAQAEISIAVFNDFDVNVPPVASIATDPSPPDIELIDGVAFIQLDGSESSNGISGEDDCGQVLAYQWRQLDGPPGGDPLITRPDGLATGVFFSLPGSYVFELEVNDGGFDDNIDRATVTVTVRGKAATPRFRRGDANGEGRINLADGISVLNWLFASGAAPTCQDAADTDDGGTVNISDAIAILTFLFAGGAPPAAPGPDTCGEDVEPDEFPRCVYLGC